MKKKDMRDRFGVKTSAALQIFTVNLKMWESLKEMQLSLRIGWNWIHAMWDSGRNQQNRWNEQTASCLKTARPRFVLLKQLLEEDWLHPGCVVVSSAPARLALIITCLKVCVMKRVEHTLSLITGGKWILCVTLWTFTPGIHYALTRAALWDVCVGEIHFLGYEVT